LPLSAIDSLRQFVPERSPDHRVRIRGTAIMQGSNGLYVQDDTGGVLLATMGAQRIAPGEIVEAVGFPEPGSLTTVLSETILRLRGYGGSPTATPIIASRPGGTVATTDSWFAWREPWWTGSRMRRAAAWSCNRKRAFLGATGGPLRRSVLVAAGIAHADHGGLRDRGGRELAGLGLRAAHFPLAAAGASDVELLREPPWWTGESARRAMLSMGILIVAISAWATILRRRVRLQTATIRKKLDERRR